MPSNHDSRLQTEPADELVEIRERLIRIEDVLRLIALPQPKRHFYSTSEVAERLQLSKWYVRRLCALGEIKAEKHPENGRFLIPEKELARIESRRDVLKHG
jgi:excisionase family DNA binding protein